MAALDQLKRMTAWEQVPTLDEDDLQACLDRFAIADADGLPPSDDDWTETYDLRAAARAAWKLKMAKAAELNSTDLDGNRMSANQVFDHCREMVRQYAGTASPVTANVPTECTF